MAWRESMMVVAPLAPNTPLDLPLAIGQSSNAPIIEKHHFGVGGIMDLALA